jgi:imidazolonepropionase
MKVYRYFSELLTLADAHKKDGRRLVPSDLSIIKNASLVIDNGIIKWVGADDKLPSEFQNLPFVDCKGMVGTPELVDSHTHLVFGGHRANEYMQKLDGVDYQEIARQGGGILESMRGTNALSTDELFNLGVERVERIASLGVGTIEVKSGYGLNYEKEKELTIVIDRLKKHFSPRVQIINTYMAAHAVPKEYKDSSEFCHRVVFPLLKDLAKTVELDFVDIFHEQGYFTTQDVIELSKLADELGIKKKTHADEFNDNKGAKLASELGFVSCDHLLATTEDGIHALAKSNTVATLLPGTGLFLGKPQAKARGLFDNGVKVAIASDYNPGSCHFDNLMMVASIAAPLYKINSAEMWSAITMNAASAVGLNDQGALVTGLKGRVAVFKCSQVAEITYNWGRNLFSHYL